METDKLIGIFLGLLSLIYTVNNSYHQNKKIFKDLFDKFNDRYNDLNDKLNDLIKRISDEEFSEKLSYTDDKTMNDYLNLCSEEYYWYKRGMIDSEVWINWLTGIKYFLKHPIFITKIKSEVSYEINNGDSYYGFLNYYERNKNEK